MRSDYFEREPMSPQVVGVKPALSGPGQLACDPRIARSRALLTQAAAQLLADGGVSAVTIDAVTRAAGVARATLYRHFNTGAELLAAAFERLVPPVPGAPATGALRERLLVVLSEQARLIQEAPLHLTLLCWLGMNGYDASRSTEVEGDRPQLRVLRQRIIDLYLQPFEAVLTSSDALAELGRESTTSAALPYLIGPLIFNRLVTREPIDESFCRRIVDDFLAARAVAVGSLSR